MYGWKMKGEKILTLLTMLGIVFVTMLATMVSATGGGIDAADVGDAKKYSYFCLEYDQTLCLGISPGEGEPFYDPNAIFYLQVKSRTRTEYTNTDYKKTRWDADYATNKISLSRFPELCAAKDANSDRVGLYPCNQTQVWDHYSNDVRYGIWDLELFSLNLNSAGTLELIGSQGSMCLTVMACNSRDNDWCDPQSQNVAWDVTKNIASGLRRGSYVRFRPCSDAPDGNPQWKNVQTFRQRLDCATGCSPFDQFNNVCDQACNREECDYDNGRCQTRSPTPPTRKPTAAVTSKPTKQPTSKAPSLSPTGHNPTVSPSKSPTGKPTRSPTTIPSFSPTQSPTNFPTIACPPPGELEYCASMNQQVCTKNVQAKEKCVWCLNKCSPRSDPRVCTIPGLFSHCKAACPTNPQRLSCPKGKTAKACVKGKWRRANCQWCGPKNACLPGKDSRMCKGDPTVFDHCGTIAPTGAPCPANFKVINACYKATSAAGCNKKKCTWCPDKETLRCRPSKSPFVCTVDDWETAPDLTRSLFGHCGKLFPTTRPTKMPTPDTMQPSKAPIISPTRSPSKSPTTAKPSMSHPSGSPTERPTKSPSTSRPSKTPTFRPSSKSPTFKVTQGPTTKRPTSTPTTKRPTEAPTKTPTKTPTTKTPTSTPTKLPTKTPTTRTPTSAPTKIPTKTPTSKAPTSNPTKMPTTGRPTKIPTNTPTKLPTTGKPTFASRPSQIPSVAPSTSTPSFSPTTLPSISPSNGPTSSPTTSSPSKSPSTSRPSQSPSRTPTTSVPTKSPTTSSPSKSPTNSPSTSTPSNAPSTSRPSAGPTTQPTTTPSAGPSVRATDSIPESGNASGNEEDATDSPSAVEEDQQIPAGMLRINPNRV